MDSVIQDMKKDIIPAVGTVPESKEEIPIPVVDPVPAPESKEEIPIPVPESKDIPFAMMIYNMDLGVPVGRDSEGVPIPVPESKEEIPIPVVTPKSAWEWGWDGSEDRLPVKILSPCNLVFIAGQLQKYTTDILAVRNNSVLYRHRDIYSLPPYLELISDGINHITDTPEITFSSMIDDSIYVFFLDDILDRIKNTIPKDEIIDNTSVDKKGKSSSPMVKKNTDKARYTDDESSSRPDELTGQSLNLSFDDTAECTEDLIVLL